MRDAARGRPMSLFMKIEIAVAVSVAVIAVALMIASIAGAL